MKKFILDFTQEIARREEGKINAILQMAIYNIKELKEINKYCHLKGKDKELLNIIVRDMCIDADFARLIENAVAEHKLR